MKVRIEGGGHVVEIEHDYEGWSPERTAELAEFTWAKTRVEHPRLTMGYAGQLTERSADKPVQGAGDYQRQVTPVTA